jgi:Helix-turn-helix domain
VVERTVFDPARVLGCSLEQARRLMRGRVVTPGEVESVSLGSYRWRAHLRDPDSYWVTVSQAADILDVSVAELRRMLSERRLPFFTHKSGVRLMRRQQIQEIARHRPRVGLRTRTLSAG